MSAKKVALITIGSIVGLVVLGILAIFTIRFVNDTLTGVKTSDDGRTKSRNYSVALPAGTVLNEGSEDTDDIYASVPTEYGDIRLGIVRKSYEQTIFTQRGEVSTKSATVDGVATTVTSIDYATAIKGRSTKPLIRYEVRADKIAKPSTSTYTEFNFTAYGTRDLTSAEKDAIEAQAEAVLESLVIK